MLFLFWMFRFFVIYEIPEISINIVFLRMRSCIYLINKDSFLLA